jgi:rubrerythrin
LHKMTEESLKAAFAGESQAHIKYVNFAAKAEAEGKANVARLFRAVAFAEQIHAGSHLRVLAGVAATPQNLVAALGGETFEVDEMYPVYIAEAVTQDEKAAQRTMDRALQAERVHAALYQRAKDSVDGGSDVTLGSVYVCGVCGWTGEGEPPDKCPLCGAPRASFVVY